ncbi:MAG: YciI family protein [Pseudomonadota bacterium]
MGELKTVPRQSQPTFLVVCEDDPEKAQLRTDFLMGHLEHVEKHWERYVVAGPLRADGSDRLVGSAFIVHADTLDDAKALMSGDPYISSGLYRSITYRDMTLSIGDYIGGKIWRTREELVDRALGENRSQTS